MPSTFSQRLRIEIQAIGENTNTWGVINNSNLGDLIEAAIAGVATIAVPDADVTLTVADGAPDQARCAMLVFTGTLTANREVLIPAVQKAYMVDNRTTHALLVRVSGFTPVLVAAGTTMPIWCDGSTTRAALTGLSALAISGALSVGGAAAVGSLLVGGSPMWSPGDIKCTARSAPETGWLFCDGALVSRTTYAALFSAIGTTYGAGDGSTTFAVPDLRGRAAFGRDNMGGTAANRIVNSGPGNPGIDGLTLGAAGGADRQALTIGQLAAHGHGTSEAILLTFRPSGDGDRADLASGTAWGSTSTFPWSTDSAGAGEPHAQMPPTLILNYVIKV